MILGMVLLVATATAVATTAQAETAVLPVTVTQTSSFTSLVDGSTVSVHVDAQSPPNVTASSVYSVDARICVSTASINNTADFDPIPGGNCVGHPLSASSDALVQVATAPPNKVADLSFNVGVGTDTYDNNGTPVTITCGPAHPCKLVLELLVPSGFVFKSFPLGYAAATTVPGAPTGVSAVPGNGAATVKWAAPPTNGGATITSYTATASPGGHTCSWSTGPLSCVVTGLTNGTAHTFKVQATNAVGPGPLSLASIAVKPGTPTAPGGVTAVPGNGAATVKWAVPVANGSPVTGYIVTPYKGLVAQATIAAGAAATSVVVPALTNGTAYTFKVQGTNAVGTGPLSLASVAVKPGTPTAPGFASATAGNGQAVLSWLAPNANGSPVTGYIVTPYKGLVAQPAITFNSTATTEVLTGLTNGAIYTFRVAAFNGVGTGPVSTIAATTIGSPLAPTGVIAVAGVGQATVSWAASANNAFAITGYVVTPYLGLVAQASRTFASISVSQLITGLSPGTYTFKVKAINANGTGAASVSSTAVTVT
jgi:hypothetical protein